MPLKIQALPKHKFDLLMDQRGINDLTIKNHKNLYIISIMYSFHIEKNTESRFQEDHSNLLKLFFDDVEKDVTIKLATAEKELKAMSEEDAHKILNFIKSIKNVDEAEIIIHCHTGKSRSIAVAHFLAEYFKIDTVAFMHNLYTSNDQKPNKTVLKLLRKHI